MAQLKDLLVTGTSRFLGDIYGNASSASKLITARMLTIGKTGKNFDGSNNISWNINDIGAYSLYDRGTVITATEDNPKDLDTLSAGNYYVLDSKNAKWVSNTPFTTGYRLICQAGYGSEGYVSNHGYQIAFAMNGDIKFRSNNNGKWGDWLDYLLTTGGTINGSLTVKKNILIDNDQAIPHLAFSRKLDENGEGGVNYITVPTDGMLSINCEDLLTGANGASLLISKDCLRPGETNKIDLGISGKKWKNVYATTFYGDLEGMATKVKVQTSNPTSESSFYIPFDINNTSDTTKSNLRTNNGLLYLTKEGTATVNGYGSLRLGNGTATGTAGNKTGNIYMYGISSGYTKIQVGNDTTSNNTVNLPSSSGTLALTTSNVASANKFSTSRAINGILFDGSTNIINYCTCSTAAATAAKVVSLTGFTLATGSKVLVKFTVTNTASNPTLNVNNTGAKAIYYRGSAISAGYLGANTVYEFVYTGTNYELISSVNTNTHYTTKLYAGASETAANSAEDNPYLKVTDNNTYRNQIQFKGGGATTVSSDASGVITIDTTYAWSDITDKPSTYTPSSHTHSKYLELEGGTMTGSIITPKNDNLGIIPKETNWGTIGTENCYFWTMYSKNYYLGGSGGKADMSSGTLKVRAISAPTASNTTNPEYSTGTSGQVLKSDGNYVYWANDNNSGSSNTSHSHGVGTGLTISGSGGISGTTTYSANLNSTTSLGTIGTTDKLYAVGVDSSGKLCVKVPWTSTSASITDYCTLTTNQTITGVKTFNASPIITNSATPKIMLIPNSTNSGSTYSNAYVEGGSSDVIKLWIDSNKNTSSSSRRGLELHGYKSKTKVAESLRLRRCNTSGTWLSDLLVYHQGNIVYSSTEPSSTERTAGMIWLKPI